VLHVLAVFGLNATFILSLIKIIIIITIIIIIINDELHVSDKRALNINELDE